MRDERGIWLVNEKTGDSVLLATRGWGGALEVANDHIWQDLANFLQRTDNLKFRLSDLSVKSRRFVQKKAVW